MCATTPAKDSGNPSVRSGLRPIWHTVVLSAVLLAIWFVWSGHFFDRLLITFGVLSCLAVVFIARRMNIVDEEGAPIQFGLRPFLYAPWLLKEIAVANIDVSKRILSPSLPVRPQMIEIKARQRSDVGRVIYANSITLTPGTVSVGMHDDLIQVHALTADAAAEDAAGKMNDKVSKLEKAV